MGWRVYHCPHADGVPLQGFSVFLLLKRRYSFLNPHGHRKPHQRSRRRSLGLRCVRHLDTRVSPIEVAMHLAT